KVGFIPGPTGVIEKVERVTKNLPTGRTATIYQLTIDGNVHEIGMHPRTIADTTDPLVWRGQTIAESWYGPNYATDVAGALSYSNEEQQGGLSERAVA